MKSIDINTIVSNDAIESISSRFDDNITLTKLTKKINCNHLVVIDKTIQRLQFKYFIHYSEDELIVFEIKKEKKRRFIFKESKNLFFINQRRAQKTEVKEFVHRLEIYNKMLTKNEHLFFTDNSDDTHVQIERDSINLILSVATILKYNKKDIFPKNVSYYQKILIANYLKIHHRFIQKKHKDLYKENKASVINYFKHIVENMIITHEIKISSYKKNSNINGVGYYTMHLKKEYVKFIENSMSYKNTFLIDFKKENIVLNDEDIKNSALNWLLSKCVQISNDIELGNSIISQGDKV
ncbi:hypothetical protein CL657_03730 [bacterium]|nr:hypothetical protein [bacterium]|tara:strand:+ start:1007 stop:1894 length:888 start_codon:yes stop_codon:yes gene_type:complete